MKESKHLMQSISQFLIDLDGGWYTVETCFCDEPYTHFISSVQFSRERTLCDFVKKALTMVCVQAFTNCFISNVYDDRDHQTLHFDHSLDDFDLHTWSQLYMK